jgi:hypothetical protein
MIWSQSEVSALIICSCAPALRIIARKVYLPNATTSDNTYSQMNPEIGMRGGLKKGKKARGLDGSFTLTFEDKQSWLSSTTPARSRHTRSTIKTNATGGTTRVDRERDTLEVVEDEGPNAVTNDISSRSRPNPDLDVGSRRGSWPLRSPPL